LIAEILCLHLEAVNPEGTWIHEEEEEVTLVPTVLIDQVQGMSDPILDLKTETLVSLRLRRRNLDRMEHQSLNL